jgi:hypothetical protein
VSTQSGAEWARRVAADLSASSPRSRGRWLPAGVLGYVAVPGRDRGRAWLPAYAYTADQGKARRVAAAMGGFAVTALAIEAVR